MKRSMIMELKRLPQDFTVCKVEELGDLAQYGTFCFVGRTDEELSLVCETDKTPARTIEREDGWKAFRIEGVLEFSLIGILSKISTVLAEAKIGIFAVSTFNTDYILVKAEQFQRAAEELETAGYTLC